MDLPDEFKFKEEPTLYPNRCHGRDVRVVHKDYRQCDTIQSNRAVHSLDESYEHNLNKRIDTTAPTPAVICFGDLGEDGNADRDSFGTLAGGKKKEAAKITVGFIPATQWPGIRIGLNPTGSTTSSSEVACYIFSGAFPKTFTKGGMDRIKIAVGSQADRTIKDRYAPK
ncbi:uncharacterized protein K452DRAFT_314066 [Aplosporella prunicola CBS 121167]|uniref:Uncharacterized protein n=1 Tax=Aplosporella prunicola CBS 121167 TaxID=1176127 RepID=A0A6A6AUI4_9PEZI|nr:uncharacterized protein K452DRAFT_314066 [Aplosporella prunicola CBS 121167]KAF2135340.1 hypothetical protein K452DRAFT_314066 [Aplosporella prunicola CBS 121167]